MWIANNNVTPNRNNANFHAMSHTFLCIHKKNYLQNYKIMAFTFPEKCRLLSHVIQGGKRALFKKFQTATYPKIEKCVPNVNSIFDKFRARIYIKIKIKTLKTCSGAHFML